MSLERIANALERIAVAMEQQIAGQMGYREWTVEDDRTLMRMWQELNGLKYGAKIKRVGATLGRTPMACKNRLTRLRNRKACHGR